MELISIVIPVYNSEMYLAQCLDSVCRQTYLNLEIVLVDDGSTDESYHICAAYANMDSRIKLVRKENGGEASARKAGFSASLGDVIMFVDSDDWIDSDFIEKMYAEMEKYHADIVVAGYTEWFGGKEKTVWNKLKAGVYKRSQLEKDIFPSMLCCEDYFVLGLWPYFWNKMFRRNVMEPYLMTLNEKLVVGVDAVCTFPAFLDADMVSIMQYAGYHYRIHQSSIMHKFRSEAEEVENIRIQYQEFKKIFENHTHSKILLPQMNRYIMHHLMVRAALFLERKMRESDANLSMLEEMEEGSKVILYGAGAFGNSLYYAYRQSGIFSIIDWCDRDYEDKQAMGYPVVSAKEALQKEFDYILIAVLSKKAKEQIQSELLSYGIESKRIRWLNTSAVAQMNIEELWDNEPVYVGYGIGHYYNVVSNEIQVKFPLSYLCDRKWEGADVASYDGIPVISREQLSNLNYAKVIIFSSDDMIKKSIEDDIKKTGREYIFADEVLGKRRITGKDIKKEGKNGLWEDCKKNRVFYDDTLPDNIQIFFYGVENCIWFERNILAVNLAVTFGNYGKCRIGANTSMGTVEINVAYASVLVGKDCLFSANVMIRTQDAHYIFDKDSMKRLNMPADVVIENQVWIGKNVCLLPGAKIGTGSVVGANAVTSSQFGDHVIIAGSPAKIIRRNICWSKDHTLDSNYSSLEECSCQEALKYLQ